ncbi:MAG: hypothetical protein GY929_18360 [Actinomycetia bacterium]|nr:hypothetical protein [Actinomycetes bacterium]
MSTSSPFPPPPAISRPATSQVTADDSIELGPLVEHLTATPPSFLAEPRRGRTTGVHIDAVVGDMIVLVTGDEPDDDDLFPLEALSRNHLRLVLITCWLLSHRFFVGRGDPSRLVWLLGQELAPLAQLVEADLVTRDPERAEELCRKLLAGLAEPIAGESPLESADRLIAIDSSRRVRLVRDSQARVKRVEQIGEALGAEAARQGVARFHRP